MLFGTRPQIARADEFAVPVETQTWRPGRALRKQTTTLCRETGVPLPRATSHPIQIRPVRLAVGRSGKRAAESALRAAELRVHSFWVLLWLLQPF